MLIFDWGNSFRNNFFYSIEFGFKVFIKCYSVGFRCINYLDDEELGYLYFKGILVMF